MGNIMNNEENEKTEQKAIARSLKNKKNFNDTPEKSSEVERPVKGPKMMHPMANEKYLSLAIFFAFGRKQFAFV